MNKKRVLVMSEAHYLNSGFGTYSKELITRLHQTGKYDIAEFASYGHLKKANLLNTPWLYIANMPEEGNAEEEKLLHSNASYQFGAWRFDPVCLSFKPDIVLSYRDPWMDDWIQSSSLRKYFHWLWMPTVDSAPQRPEWIETFSKCDAILSYSEFGGEVLKQQGKERINWIGCASPGIDPNSYKPIPKAKHRTEMGIDPDCFIVGTVMRNQKRKLFFELMKSFRIFLDKSPPDIAAKTYLYLHTSYPEKVGWNIPNGILENNLGGKVMMTYVCKSCHKFFTQAFQNAMCKCKFCSQMTAVCPTVGHGLPVEDLPKIYNLFDIYVQYAICEGFGMPQIEAAACGIPIAATDYSAMHDVLKFTKGYPIPVRTFFREMETNAERAYPDNTELANILIKFFNQTPTERMQQSIQVRKNTIERYNWDKTAKVWENYIDSYTPINQQSQWASPPNITNIPNAIPPNLSNANFIKWIFNNVVQMPDKLYTWEGIQLHRTLEFGAEIGQGVLNPTNREQIFARYQQVAHNNNSLESLRTGHSSQPQPKFLTDAYQRHQRINT